MKKQFFKKGHDVAEAGRTEAADTAQANTPAEKPSPAASPPPKPLRIPQSAYMP